MHQSSAKYAIISTGSDMIYMSKTDYLNFRTAVLASGPVTAEYMKCPTIALLGMYCYSALLCSNFTAELQPLVIYLEDKKYLIPPAGYMLDDYYGNACALTVSWISDSHNFYMLGDAFIRNFYT